MPLLLGNEAVKCSSRRKPKLTSKSRNPTQLHSFWNLSDLRLNSWPQRIFDPSAEADCPSVLRTTRFYAIGKVCRVLLTMSSGRRQDEDFSMLTCQRDRRSGRDK